MKFTLQTFKFLIITLALSLSLLFGLQLFTNFNYVLQFLVFGVYMGSLASLTQIMANIFQNPVKASACVGLFLGIALQFNIAPQMFSLSVYTIGFGATFVGMSSDKILNNFRVFIAGILYGFWAIFALPHTSFLGGAMGTLACLSCLFCINTKFKAINLFKFKQWKRAI